MTMVFYWSTYLWHKSLTVTENKCFLTVTNVTYGLTLFTVIKWSSFLIKHLLSNFILSYKVILLIKAIPFPVFLLMLRQHSIVLVLRLIAVLVQRKHSVPIYTLLKCFFIQVFVLASLMIKISLIWLFCTLKFNEF